MNNFESIVFSDSYVKEFCLLTNDPNPLHTSHATRINQGFSGLVVNGALTLSFAVGKLYQKFPELCNGVMLETRSIYKMPILCNHNYGLKISEKGSHLGGKVREYECLYVSEAAIVVHKHTIICKTKLI